MDPGCCRGADKLSHPLLSLTLVDFQGLDFARIPFGFDTRGVKRRSFDSAESSDTFLISVQRERNSPETS
jgi:hypothetical protein